MGRPSGDPLPVLWLTGPAGVGKTTVAWKLFSEMTRARTEAAYVDIDQLGICRPDPPGDPRRYRTQARNLGTVLTNFRAAGARCAIVSGVIDPAGRVDPRATPHAAMTLCRLRAEPEELRRRLVGRRGERSDVDEVLRDAAALDRSEVADLCVDTTGLRVEQVVRRVRDLTRGWTRPSTSTRRPAATEPAPSPPPPAPTGRRTRILWLQGVTGAGKSTAGFELFLRRARAGRRIAYLDLRQVAMYRPAPPEDPRNHCLKARNAAALWRTYRAAGVEELILVGQAESQAVVNGYTARLEGATVTVCRLHAGAGELRRRIMLRGQGGSWPEPGDPLRGRSSAWLERVVAQAALEAEALDQAGIAGVRVATDGLTAGETAGAVAAAVGWP